MSCTFHRRRPAPPMRAPNSVARQLLLKIDRIIESRVERLLLTLIGIYVMSQHYPFKLWNALKNLLRLTDVNRAII